MLFHESKVDGQVLVTDKKSIKYDQDAYNGPWTINKVVDNRIIKITKEAVTDVYNIPNITPYTSEIKLSSIMNYGAVCSKHC